MPKLPMLTQVQQKCLLKKEVLITLKTMEQDHRNHVLISDTSEKLASVEPRYLELVYFELLFISKWKSGPCFNMKLWQKVTK